MKMKNKLFSAAIIGTMATVISSVTAAVINRILFGVFLPDIIFLILILLLNFAEIAAAIIVSFLICQKFIIRAQIDKKRIVKFSMLAALVNVFVSTDTRMDITSIVIRFIVLFIFAFLILPKYEYNEASDSKLKKMSEKYYPSFVFIVAVGYVIFTAAFVCLIGFIEQWDLTFGMIVSLVIFSMLFSVLYTYAYFLPYLIANKKQHLQKRAIYILNIFAGWTIIAWIVALIWACTEQREKVVIQQTVSNSNADELKKYKELLDSGIISQQEFESKKKQLLGL